jgi:hypothetical protein
MAGIGEVKAYPFLCCISCKPITEIITRNKKKQLYDGLILLAGCFHAYPDTCNIEYMT